MRNFTRAVKTNALNNNKVTLGLFIDPFKAFEPIFFADDTNIFYSHTDASYHMEVVNLELKKITCWFYTKKLSINVKNIQTKKKTGKDLI